MWELIHCVCVLANWFVLMHLQMRLTLLFLMSFLPSLVYHHYSFWFLSQPTSLAQTATPFACQAFLANGCARRRSWPLFLACSQPIAGPVAWVLLVIWDSFSLLSLYFTRLSQGLEALVCDHLTNPPWNSNYCFVCLDAVPHYCVFQGIVWFLYVVWEMVSSIRMLILVSCVIPPLSSSRL